MILRTIANPRRTTLTHLDDAGDLLLPEPSAAAPPADAPVPERTANPRRTVLEEIPSGV